MNAWNISRTYRHLAQHHRISIKFIPRGKSCWQVTFIKSTSEWINSWSLITSLQQQQQDNNMRSTRREIFLKEIEVRKNHTKMCRNDCVNYYWILITPCNSLLLITKLISLLIWQGGFYHSKHAVEFAKITEPLIIRLCAPLLTNNWLLFQANAIAHIKT